MTSEHTAAEVLNSMNGFDRLAVATNFGRSINDLRDDPFTFLTALVFVERKREGLGDQDAFRAAMELSIEELGEYFTPDHDEDSPEGKGL